MKRQYPVQRAYLCTIKTIHNAVSKQNQTHAIVMLLGLSE